MIYGNIILERRSMSRIPVRMHLGGLRKDTVLDPCPNGNRAVGNPNVLLVQCRRAHNLNSWGIIRDESALVCAGDKALSIQCQGSE